jgi:hypothetical protein
MDKEANEHIFQNASPQEIVVNSNLTITTVHTMDLFKEFYKFPFKLYSKKENWVAPFWDEIRDFFKTDQLFWSHAQCQLFIAYRNNEIVGRIAVTIDHSLSGKEKTTIGFFGFFESINDYTVAKGLLDTAQNWLKQQGMKQMQGPVNGRVDVGSGFVIKGYKTLPYLLGHYSKPYYVDFMEQYTLKKDRDLVSYHIDLTKDIPDTVQQAARRCEEKGISIRRFKRFHYTSEMKWWISMLMEEFADHWGYTSSSEQEVKERFGIKQLRFIVDTRLFLIAEQNGQPIGFRWSLPDYNQLFKDMNGTLGFLGMIKVLLTRRKKISRGRFIIMGIQKKYRGMGIGTMMNYHTLIEMKKRGYKSAEYGWIDEKNIASCKAGEKIGGELYKIYRIYKMDL